MRPIAITVFGLAGLALAYQPSIMERQLQTIVNVLNSVNTATKALDSAIEAYNGGDPAPLLTASHKVLDTTTQGTTQVNGANPISLNDALDVQKSVQTLTSTLQTTISNLISKKSKIVAAGGGATTEESLKQQLSAAKALGAAIASKVPQGVQQIAQQASSGITNNIQKGVNAFQGTPGSSSTAAAAPPTTVSVAATTDNAATTTDTAATTTDTAATATQTAATTTATAALTTETAALTESVATTPGLTTALEPNVSVSISTPAGVATTASVVSIVTSGKGVNGTTTTGVPSQFTGAAASYGPQRIVGALAVGLAIFAF